MRSRFAPGAVVVLSATLLAATLLTLPVATAPRVGADPGLALQVDASTGLPEFQGRVLVAPTTTVAVTFANTGATDAELDSTLVSFADPSDLLPGAPLADAISAAGTDPSTVVHETASVQVVSDSCSLTTIPPGGLCTVELEVLPTGVGAVRPFGASIVLRDPVTEAEAGRTFLLWPAPVPSNDDFADATDISTLTIPPLADPPATVTVVGDTTVATREPGEYWSESFDGNTPAPWEGSVWYRYTSPANGFAGRLGYRVDAGFDVRALVPYTEDDLGARMPVGPPGSVEHLMPAAGNTAVPGDLAFVRMEPGQTVWIQVQRSHFDWTQQPGPFTLELFEAPNPQDDIALAYDVWSGAPYADNSGWGGDGDTFHLTADAPGAAPANWFTHVFDRAGTYRFGVESQTAGVPTPSPRPLRARLYRAPSTSIVTSVTQLGPPVLTVDGSAVEVTPYLVNGNWVTTTHWSIESGPVAVTPGRYYLALEEGAQGPTWFGIVDTFFASGPPPPDTTDPVVTITSPADGAELLATDVPALAYSCTDDSGTVAGEQVTIDGQPGGPDPTLPTGLGGHTVTVTCTDGSGNSATATAGYTVVPPPNRPPVAVDDTLVITAGQTKPVNLLAGDSDPDNDPLGLVAFYRPGGVSGPGTLECTGNACTYAAPVGSSGTDTFAYRIGDGRGGFDEGTLSVTINPPPATADQVQVTFSGGITHQAGGDLWIGDVKVTRDSFGVRSVTGGGTFLSGGTNTNVQFSIHRVWNLPFWSGTVRVRNNAFALDVTTPILGSLAVAPDGTVSGRSSWFRFTPFPFSITPYTLAFSVRDGG